MMNHHSEAAFIGLDVETTGLDPGFDLILEIGVVLFDRQLRPLKCDSWVVQPRSDHPALAAMDPVVVRMHRESGLSADIADGMGRALSSVSLEVRRFIESWTDKKLPMLGSSVTFDRVFLDKHMPEVLEKFHHRSLDASSVRLAALTQFTDPGDAEVVLTQDAEYFADSMLDELGIQSIYRSKHRPVFDICASAGLAMASIGIGRWGR